MLAEHSGGSIAPDFAQANRAWIADCMGRGVYRAWIAEDADGVAGVVGLRDREASPRPADPLGREAYVQNLYVEPHARRQGIGRALVHEVLAFCEAQGVTRIALRASEEGRALYETLGFVDDTQMIYRPPPRPADQGSEDVAATAADALLSRRSTRSFYATPVPRKTIEEILKLASLAPSGSNIQPWRVHVLTGAPLNELGSALQRAYLDDDPGHGREYNYYTDPLFDPYLARRRACGWGLYGLLGIERGEKGRMKAQRAKNYNFFGAPVGMVFSIDKRLEIGSWMDYGMFLQSIMLAARGFGLHTCAQASIAEFPRIVREHTGIGEDFTVVCGMAMGYRDPNEQVNSFQPERLKLDAFATFLG